jgi:glycerophosphoryl diester phosphodiesterase
MAVRVAVGVFAWALLLAPAMATAGPVYFQSHRGGMHEVPENTMVAFEHSWAIPGAIPEMDLRTTRDGVIVCIHDATLRRTVDAPRTIALTNIRELDWEQIHHLDAGAHFDAAHAGETIPRIEELFAAMAGKPERLAWLDIKEVDLDALEALIDAYGVRDQVLFVDGDFDGCRALRARFPESEVMTWCSGDVESIRACYAEHRARDFEGVTILQFHMRAERVEGAYEPLLGWDFLRQAVDEVAVHGVTIQARPFDFDADFLRRLMHAGIRWFVSDDPAAFQAELAAARADAR